MIESEFNQGFVCAIGEVCRTSRRAGNLLDEKLQCTESDALKFEAIFRGLYIGCMRPPHMRFVPIRQSVD